MALQQVLYRFIPLHDLLQFTELSRSKCRERLVYVTLPHEGAATGAECQAFASIESHCIKGYLVL